MRRLYALALRLLSQPRRERDGVEMAETFAAMQHDAQAQRGPIGVAALWMRELRGLLAVSLRDRLPRFTAFLFGMGSLRPRGGGRFRQELKWAWRGVRARGARAWLIAGLLGIAIAANTLVFAVADSVVFNRVPYPDADRFVELQTTEPGNSGDPYLPPALIAAWRQQTDLFSAIHAYLPKTIFVSANGFVDQVAATDVTVGLLEAIGGRPIVGRTFTEADAQVHENYAVAISPQLAIDLFGSVAAAPGQRIDTSAVPLVVVAVMRQDFRFPDGRAKIWRVLDLNGPLMLNVGAAPTIAVMAPGQTPNTLSLAVRSRSRPLAATVTTQRQYLELAPAPIQEFTPTGQRTTLLVLIGAALCLLLTACANIASLELAHAVQRVHMRAVQLALGCSRGLLFRLACYEAAGLIASATLLAGLLAWIFVSQIESLTPQLNRFTANVIDLDGRAVGYMAAIACACWLLTTLPILLGVSSTDLLSTLKIETRTAAASRRGARIRSALTTLEVALSVLLLVGSVLFVRSYRAFLAIDLGFDGRGVAELSLTLPPQLGNDIGRINRGILDALRRAPGVVAVVAGTPPPFNLTTFGNQKLEIDDRAPMDPGIRFAVHRVDPTYFEVLRVPLRRGRLLTAGDPATNVVIPEDVARDFWPAEDPVGRRLRRAPDQPWLNVIGVVGRLRTELDGLRDRRQLFVYAPPSPPRPARVLTPDDIAAMAAGNSTMFLDFTVRLADRADPAAVVAAARTVDPRFKIGLTFVAEKFERAFADRILAMRVVTILGVITCAIAAVGIYGVLAFLVAAREREIGIRMALGAGRRDINGLVLGSSMRLVLAGAALGLVAAALLARYVQSQLYQINAIDPLTYAGVASSVVAVAMIATWQPARLAASIDPAITLRRE